MSDLTRQSLDNLPKSPLHNARNVTKADVYLVEWEGQKLVVKDIAKRALLGRLTISGWLLKREIKALDYLTKNQIAGVPKLIATGPNFFAMEYSSGTQLKKFRLKDIGPEIFPPLEKIISDAHAIGVTHGDLHRENVLIGDDGSVSVIDWATASVFGNKSGLKNATWREWRALDLRGLAKLKSRYAPNLISDEEIAMLENGSSPLYRTIRNLGFRIRRIFGNKRSQCYQHGAARYVELAKRRDKTP